MEKLNFGMQIDLTANGSKTKKRPASQLPEASSEVNIGGYEDTTIKQVAGRDINDHDGGGKKHNQVSPGCDCGKLRNVDLDQVAERYKKTIPKKSTNKAKIQDTRGENKMIAQIDPSPAWFIDRDRERKKFQKILNGTNSQRIMTIRGGPGIGKTWLINHFRYECSCQQLPYALVDFSARSQGYNYLEVLRSIRDALGPHYFNDFTDLVNQYFIHSNPFQSFGNAPSSSSVDIHSSPRESTIDNIAGRDIIRDNHFYFSRPETPRDLLLIDCQFQAMSAMMRSLPMVSGLYGTSIRSKS
jgi:hypothetical protein